MTGKIILAIFCLWLALAAFLFGLAAYLALSDHPWWAALFVVLGVCTIPGSGADE